MISEELTFNLYCALAEVLAKVGVNDIPSVIDQLVGKNCGEYADMYNEYKNQQKELENYKKALELICYYIEYEYPKKNDDIYYRKARELEMIFLNKAKERLNDNKKDTEMD